MNAGNHRQNVCHQQSGRSNTYLLEQSFEQMLRIGANKTYRINDVKVKYDESRVKVDDSDPEKWRFIFPKDSTSKDTWVEMRKERFNPYTTEDQSIDTLYSDVFPTEERVIVQFYGKQFKTPRDERAYISGDLPEGKVYQYGQKVYELHKTIDVVQSAINKVVELEMKDYSTQYPPPHDIGLTDKGTEETTAIKMTATEKYQMALAVGYQDGGDKVNAHQDLGHNKGRIYSFTMCDPVKKKRFFQIVSRETKTENSRLLLSIETVHGLILTMGPDMQDPEKGLLHKVPGTKEAGRRINFTIRPLQGGAIIPLGDRRATLDKQEQQRVLFQLNHAPAKTPADKIVLGDQTYTNPILFSRNIQTNQTLGYYAWFPQYSVFSNWATAPTNGFPTSEHAFIYEKLTRYCGIERKAARAELNKNPSPEVAKKIGREHLMSDEKLADYNRGGNVECMMAALRYKFRDEGLKKKLLSTGDKFLVENADWDKIWGVGKPVKNPYSLIIDYTQYPGKNLLGEALMQVRRELNEQNKPKQLESHKRKLKRKEGRKLKEKVGRKKMKGRGFWGIFNL